MRDLILMMSMSLDGFVSGPGGDIGWIFGDDQAAVAWKVTTLSNASLHIMGSRTFQSMAGFWPTATGPFAAPMNDTPKAVFSARGPAILSAAALPDDERGADSWARAHVASGDLAQEIARLKSQPGQPIVAHGGAAFARSLIAHNLIHQYRLMVHPIVLGDGLPIFSDVVPPRRLKLVGSTAFPGGTVAQIYQPA